MKALVKHIRTFFITGLLTLLPITLTFWILGNIFIGLDSILGDTISNWLGFKIPGLGLILGLSLILIVGMITSNVVGKKMTTIIEKNLIRIPVLKSIYTPIRDILKNFSDKKSSNFKKAVLVEYPKADVYSMGFITKGHIQIDGLAKTVIFIPTTPNPTSGFLIYVDKDKYMELDIPVDVALKSIVSLGSVSPDTLKFKNSSQLL